MARVCREDWLTQAQALAVGRNIRVPHKGDRTDRPNLIVYNTPEKWSCWCMSCHTGDGVMKEHVRFETRAPKESTVPTLPLDMRPVHTLPDWELRHVAHFLARKGMDLTFLGDVFYSKSRERLIIQTPQGYAGRDITEKSQAKWLMYSPTQFIGWPSRTRINIVTEDTFSAYKVDHALEHFDMTREYAVSASLGTAIQPGLMVDLMLSPGVLIMYDGDGPGYRGAAAQVARLKALNVRAVAACAPEGFDPKDMQLPDIAHLITEVQWIN